MGLKGKIITEVEVRSSADKFHHQLRHQPHHISTFSDIVHKCELHSGNFGQHGSTIIWHYTQPGDGKVCTVKQLVEVDEENRKIKFTVIEGDVMADYKSMVATLETIPQQQGLDLIRWTLDYEKLVDDGPHPVESLQVLITLAKHIEVEHVKSN